MTTRYDVTGTQGMFEPSSKEKVLANKLGIVDPADMDEAELVLLQKLYESVLQEHLPTGRISANHLKIWHRRWLGNVYAWAGHLRSVNMSKDGFPLDRKSVGLGQGVSVGVDMGGGRCNKKKKTKQKQ